jgi:hypothetical protein
MDEQKHQHRDDQQRGISPSRRLIT